MSQVGMLSTVPTRSVLSSTTHVNQLHKEYHELRFVHYKHVGSPQQHIRIFLSFYGTLTWTVYGPCTSARVQLSV